MAEQAKIARDQVVSIDYRLLDDDGSLIETTEGDEPLTYLHGRGELVPGLERALEGKVPGDTGKFHVPAADAYGDRDPEKVLREPMDRFGFPVEVGQVLQARLEDGGAISFQVLAVDADGVTLDANHPLAGKNLNFEVTVRAVRPATEEELSHGHAHGEGHGHHH